jgi:hypothetical protein
VVIFKRHHRKAQSIITMQQCSDSVRFLLTNHASLQRPPKPQICTRYTELEYMRLIHIANTQPKQIGANNSKN